MVLSMRLNTYRNYKGNRCQIITNNPMQYEYKIWDSVVWQQNFNNEDLNANLMVKEEHYYDKEEEVWNNIENIEN